jgi:hypothetical protein
MRRREFITLLGGAAAAWPLAARAQQPAPVLIGVLNAGAAATLTEQLKAFGNSMRSLGYVENRDVRFEYRFADGYLDRLPDLAAELVRLNPKIIVSSPVPANMAVAKATSTIPIVMASGADRRHLYAQDGQSRGAVRRGSRLSQRPPCHRQHPHVDSARQPGAGPAAGKPGDGADPVVAQLFQERAVKADEGCQRRAALGQRVRWQGRQHRKNPDPGLARARRRACELARDLSPMNRVRALRDRFWQGLQQQFGDSVVLNGHSTHRLPNTLNVSFVGRIGAEILARLDGSGGLHRISVSLRPH